MKSLKNLPLTYPKVPEDVGGAVGIDGGAVDIVGGAIVGIDGGGVVRFGGGIEVEVDCVGGVGDDIIGEVEDDDDDEDDDG